MRVLVDTHVLLWWASSRGSRLSEPVQQLLADGTTDVSVSMASVWEIAIKAGTGRLQLPDAVERYIPDRLMRHGFDLLPIELSHALHAGSLPRIHGDPFDRMLIAQAQVEGLPLVTADPAIGQYDVEVIW